MKVLYIHGERRLPGQAGGAESLLRDQAEGMKRAGHECAWWYGQGSIGDAIREYQPDVCHLMTTHCYPMGMQPAIYLQQNNIPHIWHVQDYWQFCASRMMMIGDKSCTVCHNECEQYANPEYRRITDKSFIVAGNKYTADIYRNNGCRCDAVVELGVDVDLFHPEVKYDPPTIYTSRSILAGSWKGTHLIDRALQGTDYQCLVISGLPRERVAEELSHGSIFLFTSLYQETFGLSLCEAMSCGCACISFDVAGAKAQLEDGDTGILIPTGDVQALREKVNMLIADPECRIMLGKNAREHVIKDHSLEAMTQRWLQVYNEVTR